MNKKMLRWLLALAAVVGLLLVMATLAGLFRAKIPVGMRPTQPPVSSEALLVEVTSVPIVESVPASVEAKQATAVSSRILARITAIHGRSGDVVAAGQLLLELEKTDLTARAQQAREQVRAITARLVQVQSSLQRAQKLHTERLISDAELEAAQANRNALQADLAAAEQAYEQAETAVGFTEIRSPIDGRIVDRFAEPGDTATPGMKLLTLYNPMSLRVEAHIREQLALSLAVGDPVTVQIPSLGTDVPGEVEERVPAADPGSRSFLVKVRLPFDPQLLPGMYARLLVPAGEEQQLVIPSNRLGKVGQLNVVWILENGSAVRRFVRLGRDIDASHVQITSGLNSGDSLLRVPASN